MGPKMGQNMGWSMGQNMNARQGGWALSLALGVFSLIPRLYAVLAWSREPVWDGHYYDFGARRIAEGFGYSDEIIVQGASIWHPWCHYPVGYSGFLAGLYAIFGASQMVGPIANAILGAVTVMLIHRIGLQWLSPLRATIAAVLCGASLELVLTCPLVMTETLTTTLILLAFWIALALPNSNGDRTSSGRSAGVFAGALAGAFAGGILGLATLVQPQSILLAPVLGGTTAKGRLWSSKRAMGVLIATITALAVVLPWTLRNCRVMDGCAFVSTNGGWNLAIGSFPRATGRFETLRSSDGCSVVTGQVQQDRCWALLATHWIKQDPGRWIGLAPAKLGQCFDHASFPVEYLAQADPESWPESARHRWRERLTTIHRFVLSLSAFGFVALRTKNTRGFAIETVLRALLAGLVAYAWFSNTHAFWPLAIGIALTGLFPRKSAPALGPVGFWIAANFALFILLHVVFFGEDRYHVPLIPLMCLLCAAVGRASSPSNHSNANHSNVTHCAP